MTMGLVVAIVQPKKLFKKKTTRVPSVVKRLSGGFTTQL
jgi:hypothetical protein